jgi:hypothetical protein
MRAGHGTGAKCGNQIPKTAPFEVLAQHKMRNQTFKGLYQIWFLILLLTSSVETEILLNVKHPPRTLGKILPVLSNEAELEGSRVATSHVN